MIKFLLSFIKGFFLFYKKRNKKNFIYKNKIIYIRLFIIYLKVY
jgi:hypothetical protein